MDELSSFSKSGKHLALPILVGPENYDYWSKATKIYFAYKDLDNWILPVWRKTSGLSDTQDVSHLSGDYKKKFNKVLLYLTLHVAPTILHMVDSPTTPYDAWISLSEAFQSSGATGDFKIVKQMDLLTFPLESNSMMEKVQAFISEQSQICSEAASIGLNFAVLTLEQCVRPDIMRFLNKMPHDEFRNFIDRILAGLSTQYTIVESVVQELRSWSKTLLESCGQGVTALNAQHRGTSRFCSSCHKAGRPSSTHNQDCCFWEHPKLRPTGWSDSRSDRRNSRQANAATATAFASGASTTHAVYQCVASIDPCSLSNISTHAINDDEPELSCMATIEPDVSEFGCSYGEVCNR